MKRGNEIEGQRVLESIHKGGILDTMENPQTVVLENRNLMNITGVLDVLSYDDQTITAVTSLGLLTVKGSELKLNQFCIERAELGLEGNIDLIQYSNKKVSKKGETLWRKIFK